jgi:hypothetical protein
MAWTIEVVVVAITFSRHVATTTYTNKGHKEMLLLLLLLKFCKSIVATTKIKPQTDSTRFREKKQQQQQQQRACKIQLLLLSQINPNYSTWSTQKHDVTNPHQHKQKSFLLKSRNLYPLQRKLTIRHFNITCNLRMLNFFSTGRALLLSS